MTTDNRITELDGWRGLAVAAVLVGHFLPGAGYDSPAWGLNFGRVGVELFFVLSGCLMGSILFHQRTPLTQFAIRRFSRIAPSLWIYIFAATLLTYWRGTFDFADIALSTSGLINYGPTIEKSLPDIHFGHLWSVALELQGYLVLGIAATLSRKLFTPPLIFAAILIAIWTLVAITTATGYKTTEYYLVFVRAEYRLTAMIMAAALTEAQLSARLRINRLGSTYAWLTVGLLLQTNFVPDPLKYTMGSTALAIACAQLATTSNRDARTSFGWMKQNLLVSLGAASYSIYLWQQIAYADKERLGALLAAVIAVTIGLVAHRGWDQALHRWTSAHLRDLFARRGRIN